MQRIFKQHGVPAYHKPMNTLRSMLVKPKDQTKKEKQCGVVYSLTCKKCNKEYIGETARSLETRHKEHTDGKHPSSAINEHLTTSGPGHSVQIEDAKILAVEDNIHARRLREAMKIHKRLPVLNRDTGADIPPIMLGLLSHDLRGHVTNSY